MPAQIANTSPETFVRVLGALTAEASRRRARAVRIRLRTKRISVACTVLVFVALMSLVVLDLSGLVEVHALHVRPLGSSVERALAPKGPLPAGADKPAVSKDSLATVVKPAVTGAVAPARAIQKPHAAHSGAVTLLVVASRGSSWIEARRRSATGRTLYMGTLPPGGRLRLRGERVWVRFGALANLDLRLNGKSVQPVHTGTVDALFTSSGIRPG